MRVYPKLRLGSGSRASPLTLAVTRPTGPTLFESPLCERTGPGRVRDKAIIRKLADGRGFEPLVPFGTHAFQACTIDRSVTHPLRRSAADHLKFRRSGNVAVIKVAVGGIIRRAAVEGR